MVRFLVCLQVFRPSPLITTVIRLNPALSLRSKFNSLLRMNRAKTANPYESPNSLHSETAGAKCPACGTPITYKQVSLAALPVFLSCRGCDARLVGGRFVVMQAIVIFLIALPTLAVAAILLSHSPIAIGACFVGFLVLVHSMTVATVRYARYHIKGRRNAEDNG
ncbi:hypothetical protein CA13_65650 [Planctomycetes bacterium CA13]|uniref:Uncharacterized protein n=1 Tax=Novipirellula herctigrandis TaxID=2527986 RepID=A0A5C5ZEW2_9BACT|nr:hypothetical protein CA13_65650 [Planctomycetes bacterium CA13]